MPTADGVSRVSSLPAAAMWRLSRRRSCCLQLAAVTLLVTCVHLLWSPLLLLGGVELQLQSAARGVSLPPPPGILGDDEPPCPGLNATATGNLSVAWTPTSSPQLGEAGPYGVLYDWLTASERPAGNQSVTLCTHATADSSAEHAPVLAAAWAAPVSMAVFVLPEEVCALAGRLAHLRRCDDAFRRHVSVHLVYHHQHAPSLAGLPAVDALETDCARPPPPAEPSRRRELGLPYPVNVARNVARAAARTYFVLVSDAELVPSPGAVNMFLKMVERMGAAQPGHRRPDSTSRQVRVGEDRVDSLVSDADRARLIRSG